MLFYILIFIIILYIYSLFKSDKLDTYNNYINKVDNDPIIINNVSLRLLNTPNWLYLSWIKDNTLILSHDKSSFDLHLTNPKYIRPYYLKLYKMGPSINEEKRYHLNKIMFITNDFNSDFLELEKYKHGYILKKRNIDIYWYLYLNTHNQLFMSQLNNYDLALFQVETNLFK